MVHCLEPKNIHTRRNWKLAPFNCFRHFPTTAFLSVVPTPEIDGMHKQEANRKPKDLQQILFVGAEQIFVTLLAAVNQLTDNSIVGIRKSAS